MISNRMPLSAIDRLGLDRVVKRGSGEIIEQSDGALLLRDAVSGAWMLACDGACAGMPLLCRHVGNDCRLLMVADRALGAAAFEKFGFARKLECFQVAYYGKKPACRDGLTLRTAVPADLPSVLKVYHLLSPDELEKVIERKSLFIGCNDGVPVGFVGEHLEGSMGILYVYPEYRRKGVGAALEKRLIAKTMDEGFVPFGQVEKGNLASLALQKKIGMTVSENLSVWMRR